MEEQTGCVAVSETKGVWSCEPAEKLREIARRRRRPDQSDDLADALNIIADALESLALSGIQ